MNEQELETLNTSREPRELKKLANKLAASEDKEQIGHLLQFLNDPDFLGRLDSEEDYQMTYTGLRLGSIINVLMKNPAPPAHLAIVYLIKAGNFTRHILRIQLLIHALSVVRPLPPPAIEYLDMISNPESPLVYDVIDTLCINQSEPAIQLLEQKFNLLQLPDNYQKISWMRKLILPRRNDEPILGCCEKLLHHQHTNEFKFELIDVLFDYKPEDWYVGCNKPKPPPREAASEKALEILQRIGRLALGMVGMKPQQREQVQRVLKDIAS